LVEKRRMAAPRAGSIATLVTAIMCLGACGSPGLRISVTNNCGLPVDVAAIPTTQTATTARDIARVLPGEDHTFDANPQLGAIRIIVSSGNPGVAPDPFFADFPLVDLPRSPDGTYLVVLGEGCEPEPERS
jgi:hypothetical protein